MLPVQLFELLAVIGEVLTVTMPDTLVFVDGVLHVQLVRTELLADGGQNFCGGQAEVHSLRRAGISTATDRRHSLRSRV